MSIEKISMDVKFQINKERNIIKSVVTGTFERKELELFLSKLRDITTQHKGYKLLVDLRDTDLDMQQMDMYRIMDIVTTLADIKEQLDGQIAHVIPNVANRVGHAEDIGSVASIRGLNYKVFTDMKQALKWLG